MAEEKNKEAVEEENKVEETKKSEEVNLDNSEKNDRTGLENLKVIENIDVKLTVEVGGAEIKLRELLRINEQAERITVMFNNSNSKDCFLSQTPVLIN